jgi:hypothetical protein
LRAYTPREQKAVKTAAETFRPNPAFDTEKTITELGVGEALVSVLDPNGVPTVVERTLIRPPCGRLGPISVDERQQLIKSSPVYGAYDESVDRESAYELLSKRTAKAEVKAEKRAPLERQAPRAPPSRETVSERFIKNVAGSVGREVGHMVGRQIFRGILGSLPRR